MPPSLSADASRSDKEKLGRKSSAGFLVNSCFFLQRKLYDRGDYGRIIMEEIT